MEITDDSACIVETGPATAGMIPDCLLGPPSWYPGNVHVRHGRQGDLRRFN